MLHLPYGPLLSTNLSSSLDSFVVPMIGTPFVALTECIDTQAYATFKEQCIMPRLEQSPTIPTKGLSDLAQNRRQVCDGTPNRHRKSACSESYSDP